MKRWFYLFVFFLSILSAADYDCVFVGSSPISLVEALYQHYAGKTVLILEEHGECGGAWKAIDACGVPHVDLGCHQIGSDGRLKDFLETYVGCRMVSLDHPTHSDSVLTGMGFYFSQGCYELIHNLLQLINKTTIELWMNHRLDTIAIDPIQQLARIRTGGMLLTARKIFYTSMSTFEIENGTSSAPHRLLKYPHLYLLIHDPTEPRFSYIGLNMHGASRAMNLTYFAGLAHSGQHLIVFQVSSEEHLHNGELLLGELKKRKLVDPSAYILRSDLHIYQLRGGSPPPIPSSLQPYFEKLNTASFSNMSSCIDRWKKLLPLYRDLFPP